MIILRPSFSRKIMGWALLVLGVLGLVLPFLQGFLFLAFGVFVLRDQHIWAARRWAWVAGRWPQMVGRLEAMETRLAVRLQHHGGHRADGRVRVVALPHRPVHAPAARPAHRLRQHICPHPVSGTHLYPLFC